MINKLLDKFNIKQVAAIILYSRSITSKWEVTCVLLLLSSDFFVQLYSACTAATIYISIHSTICALCVVYTYETAKRVGKRKKMSIPFLSPSRKSIKINCRSIKTCFNPGDTGQHHQKNTLGRFKIIIKDVVQEMIKYAIKKYIRLYFLNCTYFQILNRNFIL